MKFFDKVSSYFDFQRKPKHALVPLIRKYLMEDSGKEYGEFACERTIHDVLALDEDLLEYVKDFLENGSADCEEFVCGNDFTMEELLETSAFDPITAALMVQFYRRDRAQSLQTLLSHDLIIKLEETEPKQP